MKKLLYILISTSNLLLLSAEHDREYRKDTCNITFGGQRLTTDKEREACDECRYSRVEVYDPVAKKYIAHIAYDPPKCSIEYLFVNNRYRNEGIGRELAWKALGELAEHGCKNVYLISINHGFWQKLGAKPTMPNYSRHVFSNLSSNLPKENADL